MKNISVICVFCGSRSGVDPAFSQESQRLGQSLGERGLMLIYGGGGIGLMAELATATIQAGGAVTGIIPEFLRAYEVGHVEGIQEITVQGMHERKAEMFKRADAFVVMPGGMGTLDEAIEIITWKQLQIHNKPIVFVNIKGYWNPFLALVDHVVNAGFGHDKVKDLYQVVDEVDDIFAVLQNATDSDEIVLHSHL